MAKKELREFYKKLNYEEKSYIAHLITKDKEFELIVLNQMKYIKKNNIKEKEWWLNEN